MLFLEVNHDVSISVNIFPICNSRIFIICTPMSRLSVDSKVNVLSFESAAALPIRRQLFTLRPCSANEKVLMPLVGAYTSAAKGHCCMHVL